MTKKVGNRLAAGDLERIALQFRVLGEPMRLRILEAVCDAPRTVNAIVAAVDSTQANVSKHLALMAAAGVVSGERRGRSVYYRLASPLFPKVCALMHTQLRGTGDAAVTHRAGRRRTPRRGD